MIRTSHLLAVAAMLLVAACSDEPSHHASADTPKNWWSDNYLAMWQDGSEVEAPTGTKVKPLKLQ